jgi:GNAT superfamily N-acetyltransferase
MRYKIVHYNRGLKSQIADLTIHLWSRDRDLNTAYFEWKYEQNPYNREQLIYLALHNGTVVGMRGFFGLRWQVGLPPKALDGLYADDLVIAPEHRNKGLHKLIMQAAFEDLKTKGYPYLFNLSASPITFLGSLGMGWKSIGSVQPAIKQALALKVYRSLENRIIRLPVLRYFFNKPVSHIASRAFARFTNNNQSSGNRLNRFISVYSAPKSKAMASLVERLDYDGRVRHVKDKTYFDWRFNNPLHRYRFLFWENGRLEGYLVLQKRISHFKQSRILRIVDWEASSPSVFTGLIQEAMKIGKFSVMLAWTATLPSESRLLLEQSGFKFQKREVLGQARPSILLRSVQSDVSNSDISIGGRRLADIHNWDLRMIYSMHG